MEQRRQYTHAQRVARKRIAAREDPCWICGEPIDYTLPQYHPDSFEVDHIEAVARGGTDTFDNKAASHRRCNRAKSDKTIDEHRNRGPRPEPRPGRDLSLGCPPGPCIKCRGVHGQPDDGVSFVTSRTWRP